MNFRFLKKTLILTSIVIGLGSCSNFELVDDPNQDPYKLSIPLVNTTIKMEDVNDLIKQGNSSLKIDADGKVTALYKGEVIRQDADAIFPAYPFILPFSLTNTVTSIALPLTNSYLIKNAIFKETKIKFGFRHATTQDISIKMKINEVSKGGQIFEKTYDMKYSGTSPIVYTTDEFPLDGWDYKSNSNKMTFEYEAKLADGTIVKLDQAAMLYDSIKFKYIDGYLGFHTFGIDGSVIDVSLFDKWKSGKFNFEDPKISLSVESNFGLPVRSKINTLSLTSISGNTVNLESQYVTEGINFNYPLFSEIGQVKTTEFYFDKTNSNIKQIFNEKTKSIAYDIDAIVNPDKDTLNKGFITSTSYFVVNVSVEVPLQGSVEDLVIQDTVDFDEFDALPEEVKSAILKVETTNDFPSDISIDAIPVDANLVPTGLKIDVLVLKAGTLGPNNKTVSPGVNLVTKSFTGPELDQLKRTKKLIILGKMNTVGSNTQKPLWIYQDYGIGIKMGLNVEYK